MRRGPFLILFAVSGAAALIYEVVWTRLLTLHMGHGLAAASAVLAAFMGGLALGAGAAGRMASRLSSHRAVKVYAMLELAIGVLAVAMPLLLAAVRPLLVAAYADGDGGALFSVTRLVTAVLLLCVPAACMGATFPVASRWVVRGAAHAAQDAGALYAANTFGAALGAVLAGFVLIPVLGLRGSTVVGVALNVIAAAGAIALARTTGTHDPATSAEPITPRKPAVDARPPVPRPANHPWLAGAALGASGFASLTLQVVWTRLLVQILGPTTYAFSTVVAIFIIGIAIGAAAGAWIAARVRRPIIGLACTMLVSAGCALAAASAVDWALLTIARLVASPAYQFADVLQREMLLVTALLLPMTVTFGASFPFAVAVASGRDDTVTENLGRIYALNTLGAILGSLLAGFVLVPEAGLHLTIRIVCAVCVVAALAILGVAPRSRGRLAGFALATAVTLAIVFVPRWNPALLSSGAYKYAAAVRGPNLETALTAGELLSYREGATGTVAVRKLTGFTSLAIDGKVDASNSGDMLTQRLLAQVPLLLHPNPKQVAILGLGSGVTLGSALTHPIDKATVLEISREVVDAARFFASENHRALDDRRTRLIVGDGRTHLMLGDESYDVIISEPSNPWMAGIASLFTQEFFEGARRRLAPGGVLCQWAHTYDISRDDLRSIVATFLTVFPDGALWLVGDADVLLIGSTAPLDTRLPGINTTIRRPGVAEDLAGVGVVSPFTVQSLFVASGATLQQWASGAPLQSDDRSQLEFSGPRSVFSTDRDDNAVELRKLAAGSPKPPALAGAMSAATPGDWRDRGLMLLKADAYRPAYEDLARAIAANPNDQQALDGLVRAAAPIDKVSEARATLTQAAADPAHTAARLALSRILAAQGNIKDAMAIPVAMLEADPKDALALEQLASILSDVGDAMRLEPIAQRLLTEAPKNTWSHYYAGSLFFLQNRPERAVQAARNAVALDPANAKAHNLVGACLASMGQIDAARAAFLASIAADPREPGTYTNLATLELQTGNTRRAAQYFAEALMIDPSSEAARQGLNSIR